MEVQIQGTGVFSMDVVNEILKIADLKEAKDRAVQAIRECTAKIRKENIKKAEAMISKAKNQTEIAFGMSNFILAFQGQKVIK